MHDSLGELQKEAVAALEKAASLAALKEVEKNFLGKGGKVTGLLKGLKDLPDEEKKSFGKAVNDLKVALEGLYQSRSQILEREEIDRTLENDWIDLTAPGTQHETGHIHPLSETQEEVERIFQQMGFTIVDGPEVESEFYNFEGLNIPSYHPARDMQDTFFIDKAPHPTEGKMVLRTHTSPAGQVRALMQHGAPLRVICPGRCFRNEATDASHEHTFNQVEGLLIDEGISLAHLKGVMLEFLKRLFKRDLKVRFRPGYFPFVEPGLELDMSCPFCDQKGCRVCKHSGWIEFMGCGMTHPHVLKTAGIDSEKYQGWAFGFGLTRLVMMRYAIDDIRHLQNGDLRFNEQF